MVEIGLLTHKNMPIVIYLNAETIQHNNRTDLRIQMNATKRFLFIIGENSVY